MATSIKTLDDLHAAQAERTELLNAELEALADDDWETYDRISMRRDELFDAIEEYEEAQFHADLHDYRTHDQSVFG